MFKIICSKCKSDRGFVEFADKGYVVLACKECGHQKEYSPADDLSIKYQKSCNDHELSK